MTEVRRPRWPLVVALLVGIPVLLVALVVAAFVLGHVLNNRPTPSFPSLTATPDPSVHGTVAYFDDSSRCVRLVAASGARSKDALCLGAPTVKAGEGKEVGPQLLWRADGRLEVTMFFMTGRPPDRPLWQKVVDVKTGQVADTPTTALPAEEDTTTGRATLSPTGDRVTSSSDASNGKVRVYLTPQGGERRTLLSVQGPGEYTYGLHAAFWSPTWTWVAADDDRILVVTTGVQPVTRVLVARPGGPPELMRFAVTAADLLG